jgi:hypothetical protein
MAPKIAEELAFGIKLKALGHPTDAFTGLTTSEQRREMFRAALLPVDDVTFTIRNGKRITMAMEFARIYGEPA